MNRLAILATPEDVRPESPSTGTTGLFTYLGDFIQAVCRHATAIDAVHIFVPLRALDTAARAVTALDPSGRSLAFSIEDLPHQLHVADYVAVHVPGGPRLGSVASVVHSAASAPTPVVATQHAISYPVMVDLMLNQLFGDTRTYDALICPSQASLKAHRALLASLVDWVAKRHGVAASERHRWLQVRHGVDAEFWRPGDRVAARNALGLPQDATLLLCPGRFSFVDKADLDPVLYVLTELPDHLHLVLAGDDRFNGSVLVRHLTELMGLGDRVHFLRSLPKALLLLAYQAADIALLPYDSIQESFGIALLEAMAVGLPCIVPDWDGLSEIVVNETTGCVIDTELPRVPGLFDTLAELDEHHSAMHLRFSQCVAMHLGQALTRVRALLESETLRQRIGQAARCAVCDYYAWSEVIHDYEKCWANLKEEAGRAANPGPFGPRLRPSTAFAEYATRRITGKTVVVPTTRAKPDWRDLFNTYPGLSALLPVSAVSKIADGGRAEPQADDEWRAVASAWLVKHGYAELVQE